MSTHASRNADAHVLRLRRHRTAKTLAEKNYAMAQPVQGQVVMAQQPVMAQPQMAQPQMMMAQPQQMVMMQQPGMVAPAGGVAVPPGAPPGGSRRLVKHCGMTSWIICLVANLCGVPICVCQLCCPCDQAEFYIVGDQYYTTTGAMVSKPCLAQ